MSDQIRQPSHTLTQDPAVSRRNLLDLPNEALLLLAQNLCCKDLNRLLLANRRLAWLLPTCMYDLTYISKQQLDVFSILCKAITAGRDVVVTHLLEKGVNPIAPPDWHGDTPLHLAAKGGHVHMVEMIMEYETETDVIRCLNAQGITPLHLAALSGCREVVKVMLEKGVDPNLPTETENWGPILAATPLHYAAAWGQEATASLLLQKGAEVNSITRDGTDATPLHWAAESCCYLLRWESHDPELVVRALLANGADVRFTDDDQRTALHVLSRSGEYSTRQECANWANARSSMQNRFGRPKPRSIGHSAQKTALVAESHRAIAKLLLDNGADINARDRQGWTPLHYAAECREEYLVQNLLGLGADINALTTLGRDTPLRLVVNMGTRFGGVERIIELLLENGADLNSKDVFGTTALDEAKSRASSKVLTHGAQQDERLLKLLKQFMAPRRLIDRIFRR